MNKRKKRIYLSILAVAGLALLADRMSSGSAPASVEASTSRSLAELGVTPVETETVSVAAAPFPETRGAPERPELLRDVFAPTAAVRSLMLGGARSDGARRGGRREAPLSFEEAHELKGVMSGARDSFAVVDDRWLRVGDRVDECTLVEMSATTATFRCPAGDVVLSVLPVESSLRRDGR